MTLLPGPICQMYRTGVNIPQDENLGSARQRWTQALDDTRVMTKVTHQGVSLQP